MYVYIYLVCSVSFGLAGDLAASVEKNGAWHIGRILYVVCLSYELRYSDNICVSFGFLQNSHWCSLTIFISLLWIFCFNMRIVHRVPWGAAGLLHLLYLFPIICFIQKKRTTLRVYLSLVIYWWYRVPHHHARCIWCGVVVVVKTLPNFLFGWVTTTHTHTHTRVCIDCFVWMLSNNRRDFGMRLSWHSLANYRHLRLKGTWMVVIYLDCV